MGQDLKGSARIPVEPFDAGRRSLLRVGLFGSLALAGAGTAALLGGCTQRGESTSQGYQFLRDADLPMLRAVVPAVLASMLPAAGAERERLVDDLLQRVDLSCYRLGPPAQKMVAQLFDLLNLRATRWALTGIGAWEEATPQQLQAFLERWRGSSFSLLNAGYRGLVKLVAGAFYGTPAGWAAANYPGPPPGPYQVFNS
jgi:hypothetical protein